MTVEMPKNAKHAMARFITREPRYRVLGPITLVYVDFSDRIFMDHITGWSICAQGDTPNPALGRAIALQRALNKYDLRRSHRIERARERRRSKKALGQ